MRRRRGSKINPYRADKEVLDEARKVSGSFSRTGIIAGRRNKAAVRVRSLFYHVCSSVLVDKATAAMREPHKKMDGSKLGVAPFIVEKQIRFIPPSCSLHEGMYAGQMHRIFSNVWDDPDSPPDEVEEMQEVIDEEDGMLQNRIESPQSSGDLPDELVFVYNGHSDFKDDDFKDDKPGIPQFHIPSVFDEDHPESAFAYTPYKDADKVEDQGKWMQHREGDLDVTVGDEVVGFLRPHFSPINAESRWGIGVDVLQRSWQHNFLSIPPTSKEEE